MLDLAFQRINARQTQLAQYHVVEDSQQVLELLTSEVSDSTLRVNKEHSLIENSMLEWAPITLKLRQMS
jgi:hypothetical protein